MAIGPEGLLHSKIIIGAYNHVKYLEFLCELSEIVADVPCYFVMNNCRIHKEIELDREEHEIRYLPPYSPFLNPIEAAFSCLKAKVKAELSSSFTDLGFTYPERRKI